MTGFTSAHGKVMDKLFLDAIFKILKTRRWLGVARFTKEKSCLNKLMDFYNEMIGSVSEERTVDIVYLDFRKTFDIFPQYPH